MKSDKQRILLCDDDVTLLAVVDELLRENQFEIDCAVSLEEAKDLLKFRKYDAIITDYNLGNGDFGTQIHKLSNLPMMILTGGELDKGLLGELVVQKPFDFTTFIDAVKELCSPTPTDTNAGSIVVYHKIA